MEGVVRAYDVKGQPGESKWSGELVTGMTGTPSKPDPNKPGIRIPMNIHMPEEGTEGTEVREAVPSVHEG